MKNLFAALLAWFAMFAAAPAAADVNIPSGTVYYLDAARADGTTRVYINGYTTDVCGSGTGSFLFMTEADPAFKTMFALIMYAKMTGESLYIDGVTVSGSCRLNYVRLL